MPAPGSRNAFFASTFFVLASAALANLSGCDSVDNSLESTVSLAIPETQGLRFIGQESVEHEVVDYYGNEKYLVLDFRYEGKSLDEQARQANVNQICMAVFKNRELVKSLTAQGYDMVSVSFDRDSQYDCL